MKYLAIISFLSIIFIFSSCRKDNPNLTNAQHKAIAEDYALAESLFNDVYKAADDETKNGDHSGEVYKNGSTNKGAVDTCAVVTFNNNSGNWPKTLSIDYGSSCVINNVERKGIINLSYSDWYTNDGAVVTVSTDNFYIKDHKIEGIKTITNLGRNANNNIEYGISVQNGEITKPDGSLVTWISERTHEWTIGENTTFWTDGIAGICDDTWSVTGFVDGVSSGGYNYRFEVVDPLIKENCCFWVNDGSIKYSIDGVEIATIDYGDGTCDATGTLDIDGEVQVIIIP